MSSVDERVRAGRRHRDAAYWVHSQPGDPDHTEPERHCVLRGETLAPDELQTCLRCFTRVRNHLLDVIDLYEEMPTHLVTLTATGFDDSPRASTDETPLPGGDALSVLAAGTTGVVTSSRRGDRTHASDQDNDAPSAAAVLAGHEDDWRHLHHHAPAPHAASVATAGPYLLHHLRWASQTHPAFEDFADDIARLRSRMQVITGAHQPPVRAEAACFDCGGRLVQVWTDEGLSDSRSCDDCYVVYSPARYLLAVAERIETQRAQENHDAASAA